MSEGEVLQEVMGWLTLTKQHERPVIAHEGIWYPALSEPAQRLILTFFQARMKDDHDH